jgi:hypothetical protein
MSDENTEGNTATENHMAAQNWADPTGKGILAAMDEIDFTNDFQPKPFEPEPAKETKAEPAKEEPAKETKQETNEEPLMDEDFFGDTETKEEVKEEKKEDEKPSFDETAFDKETAELEKGMGRHQGDKFKELRNQLKEFKKAEKAEPVTVIPEETKKELETLRTKAQEIDGLRQRIEEMSSVSAEVKMKQSDDYRIQVVEPAAKLFELADKLSESYEMDTGILRAIIKEGDRKKQNELIKEHLPESFTDFDRHSVYRMAQDFEGFKQKHAVMLADAETLLEKQEAKRIEETNKLIEEQRATTQTLQKDIWSKYKDMIPGLAEDGKETEDYRKMVAKGLSIDFSKSRAKDQAFAAFAGTVLPFVMKKLNAVTRELAERDKADGKEVQARPKPGESLGGPQPKTDDKPKTFMEAMMAADLR